VFNISFSLFFSIYVSPFLFKKSAFFKLIIVSFDLFLYNIFRIYIKKHVEGYINYFFYSYAIQKESDELIPSLL